jgi:hypothetical protein
MGNNVEERMAEINDTLEHRIRERAFQLWQDAGSPEGRAEEFWQRAYDLEIGADKAGNSEDIVKTPGVIIRRPAIAKTSPERAALHPSRSAG